jgi:hypothetical protein
MTRLFPMFPFHPDETPWSWAARMAAFHINGPVVLFLRDLGLDSVAFTSGDPCEVAHLCDLAGQDPQPVLRNTVVDEGFRVRRLGDERLQDSLCRAADLRFCPLCLAEDDATAALARQDPAAYRRERLIWRLKPVRRCPVHGLPLVRRNRPETLAGPGVFAETVPETASGLAKMGRGREARLESPLQPYVIGRVEGQTGPAWLDSQTLDQAVRATEMLGAVLAFGPHTYFEDLSVEDQDAASAEGYKFASRGEPGIRHALRILQVRSDQDDPAITRRIENAFGTLLPLVQEGGDNSPICRLLQWEIAEMTGTPA